MKFTIFVLVMVALVLGFFTAVFIAAAAAQNSVPKEMYVAPESVTWGELIQARNGKCVGNGAVIIYPTLKAVIPGNQRAVAIRLEASYCEGGQWVPAPVIVDKP